MIKRSALFDPSSIGLERAPKRKVPSVGTFEPPEESSTEDEKPIRYFVSVIHSIISFLIIFAFNSVNEDESP